MRIVFVHHHLRPGGVTHVIDRQIKSLPKEVKVLVVVGEPPSQPPGFPFVVVRQLAYDRDRNEKSNPEKIVKEITRSVKNQWSKGADLFHFHNPTLGKNKDLLKVVKILIEMGERVLLQIHDFAEDGRPLNYCREQYPADCHYAVLNTRDYKILLKSGLKPEGLHLIPNPVVPLKAQEDQKRQKKLVLYPVRAIRRKNIGEAIFLSLFLKHNESVGITLEPTSSIDCKSYNDWRAFVREKNLKVQFRLGIDSRFEEILQAAKCMISTSIKEGFGYCFLEPWTSQKMLFGRLLEDICGDFTRNGLELDHLYKRIAVPLSIIDRKSFFKAWKKCYGERLKMYGLEKNDSEIEKALLFLTRDGNIDLGYLNEGFQREVILGVIENKRVREKILDLNPFLEEFSSFKEMERIIKRNRRIVKECYSLSNCRKRLLDVYKKVMDIQVVQSIDKRVVLEEFNTPDRSHLLLCDSAYG